MVDLAARPDLDEPSADDPPPLDSRGKPVPKCNVSGCNNYADRTGPGSGSRRQCAEHLPASPKRRGRKPRSVASAQRRAPKVTAADMANRATELVGFIGTVVAVSSPADGADIVNGAPQLGAAIGQLAAYEPWLARALSPEGTGRVTAWAAVAFASLAMATPILARHGMLPGPMAQAFAATHAG